MRRGKRKKVILIGALASATGLPVGVIFVMVLLGVIGTGAAVALSASAGGASVVVALGDPLGALYGEAVTIECPGLDWRVPTALAELEADHPGAGIGLNAGQELAAEVLASPPPLGVGMHLGSARAWMLSEGGGANAGQPPNNFLFMKGADGGWASFASPQEGAAAVVANLNTKLYAPVLAAMGQDPMKELAAIAASGWDGGNVPWGDPRGHYGGDGRNLVGAYTRIRQASDPADALVRGLCAAGAATNPAAAVLAHTHDQGLTDRVMALAARMAA